MPAPEKIPVKLTEEVAESIAARPVLRQTFTLHQLVDMILATCGKNKLRLREILASGTCTYNVYRYWWDGFGLDDAALEAILAEFPDPDSGRIFEPQACTWVALASAAEPTPHRLTLERASCARRWLRRRSFWDFLMALARSSRLTSTTPTIITATSMPAHSTRATGRCSRSKLRASPVVRYASSLPGPAGSAWNFSVRGRDVLG